ncbi:hypothetical protein BCHO_0880 [Bifidobacterium choerinum]|uniref:Uncharacterized protein n=2 Tax=Bifidobacterium choerinum TaxID=35760 RepID=A0A087AFB1_9BIFI|nr:hypothetical protein BCHO_0880 [Bifidobacterium choerinum]
MSGKKKPMPQDALVPDELTPDMTLMLMKPAADLYKACAAYLMKVRTLMETRDKDSWREKWPDSEMSECVEVVYDTADMAQRMLKTAQAINTMLTTPLNSHHAVLLDELRNSLEPDDVDMDTGELQ